MAYTLPPASSVLRSDKREGDRRLSPRLEVEALLDGVLVAGDLRLSLRDLSFGGFAVESPIGFTIGSRHAFRFTSESRLVVTTGAEVIYSRAIGPRDGMAHHVTGFRFTPDGPEGEQAVQLLIDVAVAPLSFR